MHLQNHLSVLLSHNLDNATEEDLCKPAIKVVPIDLSLAVPE